MLLAPPSPSDLAEIYALQSDPRVWSHLPSGRVTDKEQVHTWIEEHVHGWADDGLSTWIARDRADQRFLGYGGCALREGTFWNLGYRFRPEEQGRGLATELSTAAIAAAHDLKPDVPVVAYLLEHNLASAAVAHKLGFTVQYRGPDAGNPDPQAIRLVFADRELTAEQLQAAIR